MKKVAILIGLLFISNLNGQVWINEISYDNIGNDSDDFIEIVAPIGTDMSSYGILLANGDTDISYGYVQLIGTITNTNANNGFGFFILLSNQSSSITVPIGVTSQTEITNGFGSGIQSGAPDGVLLLNSTTGATIHGIWYEETGVPPTEITRNPTGSPPGSGPYSMTGVDVTSIGDNGNSAIGASISIDGDGNTRSWEVTLTGTPGNINTNQTTLPVELSSFSAIVLDNSVKLNWRTETEVSNYGFEVERLQDYSIEKLQDWRKIGFVQGHGNSNSPKEYFFLDETVTAGIYSYRLKQIDTDGQFEYSKVIEVNVGNIPDGFVLEQNYPNPFNPSTTIKFAVAETQKAELKVFDILGNEVKTLFNDLAEGNRVYEFEFDATNLSSGLYIYKLVATGIVQSRKMMLIK